MIGKLHSLFDRPHYVVLAASSQLLTRILSRSIHSFSEFFKEMSLEECKAFYEKYPSLFELIEAIKDKLPYFDNGHSGNSMSMSWMLYRCYKEKPELVPYMHGCLAQLVGDEGYHDNRSDVPKL